MGPAASLGAVDGSSARIPLGDLHLRADVATAFPPSRAAALARLAAVDPRAHARTRNHRRGAVARLSPDRTHGLLTVPEVVAGVGHDAGKLVQERAWREYLALLHAREGRAILHDRFGPPPRRASDAGPRRLPRALMEGRTGIEAIDDAVRALRTTGYVHDHARMWVAADGRPAARPGPRDPLPTAFAHRWTRPPAPRSYSAFWREVGA